MPEQLGADQLQTASCSCTLVPTRFAVVALVLCRTLAHGRKLSKGKIISINVREIWCAATQLPAVHACTAGTAATLVSYAACVP